MSVTLETKTLILMDPGGHSDHTETKAIAGGNFSSETTKTTIGCTVV